MNELSELKTKLSGLQKVCRTYGRMKCGETMMVWDYANECAVPESEMKPGSERWKGSERAKWMPAETNITASKPHSPQEA
jgi:hypothetical protein